MKHTATTTATVIDATEPQPIWTRYRACEVQGELGWVWQAPDWHLIYTLPSDDDGGEPIMAEAIVTTNAEGVRLPFPAGRLAEAPYLPLLRPAVEPGETDALEISLRFAPGASATHAFGHARATGIVYDAVVEALGMGRRARATAPSGGPLTDAARAVICERERQKGAEAWSTEHDDGHIRGELAAAAACYAAPARERDTAATLLWPATWDRSWWKPGRSDDHADRRRDLVKAGALILAEIERLDRLERAEAAARPAPEADG